MKAVCKMKWNGCGVPAAGTEELTMRRTSLAALLLAAVLLICTACGEKPAAELPIDRVSGYPEYALEILDEDPVDLVHIDRQTCPDTADALLSMAEDCLAENGIKAGITDLYSVPLGMAALEYSCDPVIILTDDEAVNDDLLFMVPVQYDDQLIYAGSFRDSEDPGDYRGSCAVKVSICGDQLAKSQGLCTADGTESNVLFNIFRLNGLQTEEVPAEIEEVYRGADAALMKYCLCDWRQPDQWGVDADGYYTILDENVRTLDGIRSMLGEYFSEEITDWLMDNYSDPYKEEDGVLKTMDVGMGSAIDLEDYRPVKIARIGDGHMYLIAEARRIVVDWDDWNTDWLNAPRYSEYYLFELEQTQKGWTFTDYTDIPFGFI